MRRLLSLSFAFLAASLSLTAQTYTVLHNFGSGPGDPSGLWTDTSLAQGRDGGLFTTSPGAQKGIPAAFRIGPLGSFRVLHAFASGSLPSSGLILATDGGFYGTTETGGPDKLGTVFRVSNLGAVTTLHAFTGGSDGDYPWSVMQSAQGDFYITTASHASHDYGSIFRMTDAGNLTLLHAFNGTDGAFPLVLVQGVDSMFYGVTAGGGTSASGFGTIFRISASGDFRVLHRFDNKHGSTPEAGLIQANDGNFYGTTLVGGNAGSGVLFRVTPAGQYTVLHQFTGGADGANPYGRLVQASDGNLYGTTTTGGDLSFGVIFRATLDGAVVPLYSFVPGAGYNPDSQLFQHTNGKLFGGTWAGGKYGKGVFFSFDAGLPPFVTYLPTYGRVGAIVQILGQGFTADSKVSFNGGSPTSPLVVHPTYLQVQVPPGATTGPITVTTSTGTLTSNRIFIVHP